MKIETAQMLMALPPWLGAVFSLMTVGALVGAGIMYRFVVGKLREIEQDNKELHELLFKKIERIERGCLTQKARCAGEFMPSKLLEEKLARSQDVFDARLKAIEQRLDSLTMLWRTWLASHGSNAQEGPPDA